MEGGITLRREVVLLSILVILVGPVFGSGLLARQGRQPCPQVTMPSSPIREDALQADGLYTPLERGVLDKENPVDDPPSSSPNPHPESILGSTTPIEGYDNNDAKEEGASPLSPGTVTVTGTLLYWDEKEEVYHYCRYAYCELWDEDADGYNDLLDTSATDMTGHFSLGPVDNLDEEGGGQDIYVWFYTDSSICMVYDGSNTFICGTAVVDNVPDGTYSCGTMQVPIGHRGAWNILDQIVKGYQWVDNRPSTDGPPKATVKWFSGSTDGTHFHPGSHEIDILGMTSDPDEFDDGVIIHEYGHFVAHLTWSTKPYVFENSPGGSHVWYGVYSPELAWSEGWSHYFSCTVRGVSWLHDVFLDSGEPAWANYSLETGVATLSNGDTYDANANGDSCEASCGGVLWDISDSIDDDQDGDGIGDILSLTANMVWYIVRTQDVGGHGVYTINDFWTAWFDYYHAYSDEMWTIYYEHGIEKEDSVLPSNPNSYSSSHTVNAWSNNRTITVSWSGATDDLSGIYGYSHVWDMEPDTVPGTTLPTYKRTNESTLLADSGSWYLHVRVRDNAGNWASGAYHIGPFKIDGTAPSNPTSYSPIPANAIYWTNDSTIKVTWYFASDSLSGVYGFSFVWDTSSSTIPDTVVDTLGTSHTSSALADGSWYLHVRVRDNAGNWASGALHCGPLRIDTVPPTNPDSCTSSPDVDIWSTDNTIEVSWSGAADEASGISGYSYLWDHSPSTPPDTTVDTTGTSIASSSLADGSDWYFHVRVRDKAGNWAEGASHVGPFKIDTGAPVNPDSASSNPDVNVWSADNTVEISWSGASDSVSDISGYSFVWDNSPSTLPDETVDTTSKNTTSSALADGSSWYFHVIARDNAGNWNNNTFHAGPFKIDTVAPTNPDSYSSDPRANIWTADDSVYVSWSGASDGLSDVYGYSYTVDNSPSTTPDTTVDTTETNVTTDSLSDGLWFFHVRTRDSAGNWASDVYHVGPFKIDGTVPTLDSTSPENGASGVSAGTAIRIEFSESMNATATQQSIIVSPAMEIELFTWSNDNKTLTAVMNGTLQYGTEYTVSISNARDLAGNQMASYSWKFKTVARPTGVSTATLVLFSVAAVVIVLLAAIAVRRKRRSSRRDRHPLRRNRRSSKRR
jgi:hypothetical protein